MRFVGRNGMGVELRVAGYQFPDNVADSVNWLMIEGDVRHPRGSWSFREPCLLIEEATQLADWLEALKAGQRVGPSCGFFEPNLSFEVLPPGDVRLLRVLFAAESRPVWWPCHVEAFVEFAITELDLARAANEWREQLRPFPERPEGDVQDA
jgi:hypothetical protein